MDRLKVLDGLRAIAVLIVIVSHAGLGHIIPGGFGVTIFFFLSGYLITTLLRREAEADGRVSFAGFYLRRSVRIIPPMLICYAVAVAFVVGGLIDRQMAFGGVVWDLLFLTNYAPPLVPNSMIPIPLWSLDIEEHFYLLFPAVFLLILRLSPDRRMAVVGGLIGLALAFRFFEYARGNADMIFFWSHTRFDGILFGVLLTLDQARGNARGASWPWFLFGGVLILATLVIRDPLFRETLRYTLQGVGLFFVFKFLIEHGETILHRVLGSNPLKHVADWSYVLYLIHLPMMEAAEDSLTGLPMEARYGVGIAAAFLFAAAMHRYVERPLHAWRKRVEGGWQPAGPMQPKGIE